MSGSKAHILLAEDDSAHAELFEYHLRRQKLFDASLEHVTSLQAVHESLQSGPFDILLLDLSLPDSRIHQTIGALEGLCKQLPVVVLTSLDDARTGQEAVAAGAEDYIFKSDLTARRLADAIRYGIERYRLRCELESARVEAESAADAKAEFLATMSHEIRTPMNAVIGFTNLLLETSLTSEQHQFVRTIARSGESLLVLINDILDFSKIDADKLQIEHVSYHLGEAVEDVLDLFRGKAIEKDVSLRSELASDLPLGLVGDPTRLRQIFINLVGNALKFTDEGEVILRVEMSGSGSSSRVRFQVSDTGVGIPPESLELIFERFTQADGSTTRKYGGTGLGLAITKRLVELLGGSLGVESNLGQGSCFFFELPCVPAAQETLLCQRVAYEMRTGDGDLTGLRVLVADDSPTNQVLVRRILEKFGCVVDLVGNGSEALENYQRLQYDVILMDCQMPEMDGYDATRKIRDLEQRDGRLTTPIVALTAGVLPDDQHASEVAGMNFYLAKPIRGEKLRETLLNAKRSPEI